MDVESGPFSDEAFQVVYSTPSKSDIRFSIEDVIYLDKHDQPNELLVISDPGVFRAVGIPMGPESTPRTGDGPPGPEARRLSDKGYFPYDDSKKVSVIAAGSGLILPMVTGGKRKIDIASPYPIVRVQHAEERRSKGN